MCASRAQWTVGKLPAEHEARSLISPSSTRQPQKAANTNSTVWTEASCSRSRTHLIVQSARHAKLAAESASYPISGLPLWRHSCCSVPDAAVLVDQLLRIRQKLFYLFDRVAEPPLIRFSLIAQHERFALLHAALT